MTALLLFVKHHCPWVWRAMEWLNAVLFRCRYRNIRWRAAEILSHQTVPGFRFAPVTASDLSALSHFLESQPEQRLTWFHPHSFEMPELRRLWRGGALLMMKVEREADGQMAGYFFLRCFFIGRAFHGLLVDATADGRGIGTAMWRLSALICEAAGLGMYATVSTANEASLNSCRKGTAARIVRRLPNGFLLVACRVARRGDEKAL